MEAHLKTLRLTLEPWRLTMEPCMLTQETWRLTVKPWMFNWGHSEALETHPDVVGAYPGTVDCGGLL
jgi:hypothetical protein